jgi:hypothetical protein
VDRHVSDGSKRLVDRIGGICAGTARSCLVFIPRRDKECEGAMSESALSQIRKVAHLSAFCDPLPRLIEPGSTDTARSVRRFGELLGAGGPVSVGLRLTTNGSEKPVHLRTDGVAAEAAAPDLEIITSEQTWRRIAAGELAPMAAFIAGDLRFRGDVGVANRVVRRLRGESARAEEES